MSFISGDFVICAPVAGLPYGNLAAFDDIQTRSQTGRAVKQWYLSAYAYAVNCIDIYQPIRTLRIAHQTLYISRLTWILRLNYVIFVYIGIFRQIIPYKVIALGQPILGI